MVFSSKTPLSKSELNILNLLFELMLNNSNINSPNLLYIFTSNDAHIKFVLWPVWSYGSKFEFIWIYSNYKNSNLFQFKLFQIINNSNYFNSNKFKFNRIQIQINSNLKKKSNLNLEGPWNILNWKKFECL
jgi:hypothetical protein